MFVYLAHPYGGRPENLVSAKAWLRWCARAAQMIQRTSDPESEDAEIHVAAPWIPLCEVLPETDVDRRYGLRGALTLMRRLSAAEYHDALPYEVWCFREMSVGARFEASAAVTHWGAAWDFTRLGPNPPPDVFDPRQHASARRITQADVQPEWWRVLE